MDLVAKVVAKTKTRSRVVREPLPKDDPQRRRPDISLAKRLLGWAPKIDLDRGLERTIAYFATQIVAGAAVELPATAEAAN